MTFFVVEIFTCFRQREMDNNTQEKTLKYSVCAGKFSSFN